jgi:hypothetical protein
MPAPSLNGDDTPVSERAAPGVLERFGPLCEWCEPSKTEADVHEKSRSYRRRLRHAGIKLRRRGGRCQGRSPAGGNTGWMAGGSGGLETRHVRTWRGRTVVHAEGLQSQFAKRAVLTGQKKAPLSQGKVIETHRNTGRRRY